MGVRVVVCPVIEKGAQRRWSVTFPFRAIRSSGRSVWVGMQTSRKLSFGFVKQLRQRTRILDIPMSVELRTDSKGLAPPNVPPNSPVQLVGKDTPVETLDVGFVRG